MRFRCHRKRIYRFSSTLYRLNAFSTVHTKTLENDRIARWLVTQVELYVYATNTRTCNKIVHRFHFDAFSTVHKYDMNAFRFWSTSKSVFKSMHVFL